MEAIENQGQFEVTQHKSTFFVANVLQNPYLGLFIVLLLALIYLFHMMGEVCTKRRRNNVDIPRSKASDNLQAKKKRSAEHQLEATFRDELIKELKLQFQQKREQIRSQEITLKSQLTMYQSYALARGLKINTKIEMNNTKKEQEKKKKELQNMLQHKQKEQQLNRLAQKARKLSQKPEITNDSSVFVIPATRIKVTASEQQKDKLGKQTDVKQKKQKTSLFGATNQKDNLLFGQKDIKQPQNGLVAPKHDEPKIDLKKEEKPAIIPSFTGFGPLPTQQNLNQPSQKPIPSLFNIPAPNIASKPAQTLKKPTETSIPAQAQPPINAALVSPAPPSTSSASVPLIPPAPPASAAHRGPPTDKLSAFEFLQVYQKFVDNMGQVVPISSKIEDLLGARSLPSQILTEAKTQINSIDKSNDKQLNSFAQALYHNIIFQFINKSNVKTNLERIPPKSRTDQCEKNSINKYALTVNIYRLMGPCKRVWMIVFGKLLKLLDFLYKRKTDLESYHKLELIQNGYIKKYKEVHSKYLSRLDFLIYMLFALTSFDPVLVFRQIEEKEKDAERTRMEIESWGNTWSYAEFWALCGVIFANKHESYSKPIVYINLLYTLYPRIYENKRNPSLFGQQRELFIVTLQKSKKYLQGFKMLKQVKILSQCEENEQLNFEYDGYDFVKSIKVLDNRIPEKGTEFKLTAKDYEAKANIFYYFTKEK